MDNLVEVDWLIANLDAPDLRIYDATIHLGGAAASGFDQWQASHIPGSAFADLSALCDPAMPLALTMPTAEHFAAGMSQLGLSNDCRVVVYDARESMWATRLWWMLNAFGFHNVAVLNGGWHAWAQAGAPTSSEPSGYEPAEFVATETPGWLASKAEVQAAIGKEGTVLVNALGRKQHRGEVNEYGRPGHIPGSINVTAWEILDRESQRYRDRAELEAKFAPALEAEEVITYCGSGIACTSDAFILKQLGYDNVRIYDGGLMEWCADPNLPLETS